jgi:hypothetical protein
MPSTAWVQVAVAILVLTVLQGLLSFLVPPAAATAGAFGLVLLSNAMTAGLLVWIGRRLGGPRLTRALVLWAIWGGIQFNSMIETLLFDVRIPPVDVVWLTLFLLSCSAGLALFLGWLLSPRPAAVEPAGVGAPAWWRVVVCDFAYIALYFTAGALAWPWLREFYEARPMPSTAAVAAMQVFRGLVFTAIALLIVRRLHASRTAGALATGVALSVLGGIAPLLMPNPYMPEAVRYAHLPEVGVSNFLFGLLAGWLLAPSARTREVSEAIAPASA